MAGQTHQFHLLDGLRGVAACVVLWFHLSLPGFRHGYLAVDFFFMLSGFVIAFAYQKKLDEGFGFWDFMAVRVARLYPLYLLGLVLGAFWFVPHAMSGSIGMTLRQAAAEFGLGLLVLPSPPALQTGDSSMFPFNIALWSLFFEVSANAAHALFLRRRATRTLLAIVVIAAAALVWQARHAGSVDLGTQTKDAVAGLTRVVFGYVTGMLLLRAWKGGVARVHLPDSVPAGALLAGVLLAVMDAPRWGWAYDVAVLFAVLPCLLLASAYTDVSPRWVDLCAFLGTTSYAMYVLHPPVMLFANTMARRVHLRAPLEVLQVSTAVFVVLAAWLADRFYDARARAFLKQKLTRSVAP